MFYVNLNIFLDYPLSFHAFFVVVFFNKKLKDEQRNELRCFHEDFSSKTHDNWKET